MGQTKIFFLIANDPAAISANLYFFLRDQKNTNIYEARNFTEVAGVFEQDIADLVVIESKLPDAEKFVMVSLVKELYPYVTVVVLADNLNEHYLKLYKKIGADYCLLQPVDLSAISEISAVRNLIH